MLPTSQDNQRTEWRSNNNVQLTNAAENKNPPKCICPSKAPIAPQRTAPHRQRRYHQPTSIPTVKMGKVSGGQIFRLKSTARGLTETSATDHSHGSRSERCTLFSAKQA